MTLTYFDKCLIYLLINKPGITYEKLHIILKLVQRRQPKLTAHFTTHSCFELDRSIKKLLTAKVLKFNKQTKAYSLTSPIYVPLDDKATGVIDYLKKLKIDKYPWKKLRRFDTTFR